MTFNIFFHELWLCLFLEIVLVYWTQCLLKWTSFSNNFCCCSYEVFFFFKFSNIILQFSKTTYLYSTSLKTYPYFKCVLNIPYCKIKNDIKLKQNENERKWKKKKNEKYFHKTNFPNRLLINFIQLSLFFSTKKEIQIFTITKLSLHLLSNCLK